MKAVVLAGGFATRLWPITRHRAKMFLPVGERAIVDYALADLEADERVDEVFVSTNAEFADAFREHLAESPFEKATLSVESPTAEDEKFGVVAALAELVEREGVEDDLLVVAGDNLVGTDLADFTAFFAERGTTCLVAHDVGSREAARAYGPVRLDGDRVVELQEKPENPASSVTSIACYAFPAEVLDLLDEYLAAGNNPDEPGWFIQWLVDRRPVHAFRFDGPWFDVGEADAYLDAVAWRLDGENLIADGATVEGADLLGDVHVCAGATVRNATLERCVVFPDAVVEGATLRNSIVDESATVRGVDLDGARIGQHSTVPGA